MKSEISKKDLQKVKNALIKKATGYNTDEVVEEYIIEDGQQKLVKKKITSKFVPADLTASKLLFEYCEDKQEGFENMSDDQLDKEAIKLIKEYIKISDIDIKKELEGDM